MLKKLFKKRKDVVKTVKTAVKVPSAISDIKEELKVGNVSPDAARIKQHQLLVGYAAGTLIPAVALLKAVFGIEIPLNEEDLKSLASGGISALMFYFVYSTARSSAKVGLLPWSKSDNSK